MCVASLVSHLVGNTLSTPCNLNAQTNSITLPSLRPPKRRHLGLLLVVEANGGERVHRQVRLGVLDFTFEVQVGAYTATRKKRSDELVEYSSVT